MKLVGVSIYGIHVRNSENENIELHNIEGHSLIQIVNTAAQNNLNEYHNDREEENVFTFEQINTETINNADGQAIYDILYIRVKTGEYGIESEIVDSRTGEVTHNKSSIEADVMPFGCCIIIPSGQYVSGAILFQSIGRFGITTVMKKHIDAYLRVVNSDLRLAVDPILPREYANRFFQEGILKTIRIIRYGIPEDDADRYGVDRGVRDIIEERVIRRPAGFIRNKAAEIQEWFAGNRGYEEIIQIDGFEIDDLKFEIKMGNRVKTISLRNIDRLSVSEDVTEDVVIENGHPTFESLCGVMREIGEYYLHARGLLI